MRSIKNCEYKIYVSLKFNVYYRKYNFVLFGFNNDEEILMF